MTNIHDYLLWRGDVTFTKEEDLNEVDSLVLARFSYLPFDKVNINKEDTIANLTKQMINMKDEDFLYKGDKEFATYLSTSGRFMNLIVTDFVKVDDKSVDKQFGAITIHLPFKKLYVSFLGTDKTINGWKEDFNMAFMDNVPCQEAGVSYLKDISIKYPLEKILLGGHSKGGNIAIYAALLSPSVIQNRIIKVDNFDGPGFNDNILDTYGKSKIIDRIETFIPEESMIGRLLGHKEKMTICYSDAKGIFQHDIYSWEIIGKNFVKVNKNTKMSENFNNMVTEWLKNTTKEQRQIFIDTIFELLEEPGFDSFGEIAHSLKVSVPRILKKYKSLSDGEKKIMQEMIKKFYSSYISSLKKKK